MINTMLNKNFIVFFFKTVFYKKNKLQKLLVFFLLLQLGNEHGPARTRRGDVGKPT
jgi:hypothetical protein